MYSPSSPSTETMTAPKGTKGHGVFSGLGPETSYKSPRGRDEETEFLELYYADDRFHILLFRFGGGGWRSFIERRGCKVSTKR